MIRLLCSRMFSSDTHIKLVIFFSVHLLCLRYLTFQIFYLSIKYISKHWLNKHFFFTILLKIGRGKISILSLLKHWSFNVATYDLNFKKKSLDISLPVTSDELWAFLFDHLEVSGTRFQLLSNCSLKEVEILAFLFRSQFWRYLQRNSIKIWCKNS